MWRLLPLLAMLPLAAEGMRKQVSDKTAERFGTAVDGEWPPPNQWRPPMSEDYKAGNVKETGRQQENMLIPEMMVPEGLWYQLRTLERAAREETNEYKWELNRAGKDGQVQTGAWTLASLEGNAASARFGHQSVHVLNAQNREVYKIRNDKYVWNPLARRWSFRILPPHSKDSADAWFTINKDAWGSGLWWQQDEWKIYRGRERDGDLVYYCVGSWAGKSWSFFRSKESAQKQIKPLAEIKKVEQSLNPRQPGGHLSAAMRPDKYSIRINELEDTALIMSVATIIDMVHDAEEEDNQEEVFIDWESLSRTPIRPNIDPDFRPGNVKTQWSRLQQDMLVPALMVPEGSWYEFRTMERASEGNEYQWQLAGANGATLNWRIAKLEGSVSSDRWGHQSVHVFNKDNREIFKIRNNKYVWNPFSRRWSFRILPRLSKNEEDSWFTINKDAWGRGSYMEMDEWRIYRGRERDGDMLYYCVGSWWDTTWKFYVSKEEYDSHQAPVAEIKKSWGEADWTIGSDNRIRNVDPEYRPDKYSIRIKEKQDSALILAVATVIDMVHDKESAE